MSNQPPANGKKKNGGYAIANDRANDRQPHFRGKVTIEGKEWLMSMWEKEPRDGKAMFSVEFTDPATLPPRATSGSPRPAAAPAPASAPSPAPAPQKKSDAGGDAAFDDIFGGGEQQW